LDAQPELGFRCDFVRLERGHRRLYGLSLGSLLFGRLVDRIGRPWLLLGLLEIGIAVCALAFPAELAILKTVYVRIWPLAPGLTEMSLLRFCLAVAALIPPTTLMGGTFPAAVVAYSQYEGQLGRDAG